MSLVLVLAMVFSFATTAFAAGTTYDDDDQIQYTEAVQVMTDMGIINGKGDNLFAPTDQFLRSEAAKIITYMKVGPAVAETLPKKGGLYTDVAADEWFAPFVAYATAQKIIAGNGDGTFEPEADLSREAWLKMLLCGVLGVDAEKNGLVNNDTWEINALTMAIDMGIIDTEEAVLPFNRDVAVRYAWNAMTSVEDKNGETYGFKKFDLTKTAAADSADAFERPQTKWTFNCGKKESVVPATPVKVYTEMTKAIETTDITKDLGLKAEPNYTIYVDGAAGTTIGGRGARIEVYETDEGEYTVVVINTYAAKVEKVSEKDADGKIEVTVETNKTFKTTDEFAKDDIVLYTKANDVIQTMEKATVQEGTLTAVGDGYIRVDGEKVYPAANKVAGFDLPKKVDADEKAANYYFDHEGNLVYSDAIAVAPPAGPDGVFYVLEDRVVKESTPGDGWTTTPATDKFTKQAKVLNLTTGEIEVKNLSDKVTQAAAATPVNKFATYTEKDGIYTLDDTVSSTATIVKGKASIGTDKYATDATEIIIVNKVTEDGKDTYSVSTATGIPTFEQANTPVYIVDADNDGNIETLYVVDEPDTVTPVTSTTWAVYVGKGELDAKGQTYQFAVNGKIESYYAADPDTFTAPTVGAVVDLQLEDGKVKLADPQTADPKSGGVAYVNSNYVRTVNGVTYFAEEYEVVDATANYQAATFAKGDTVDLFVNDKGEVVFAVITAHPAP